MCEDAVVAGKGALIEAFREDDFRRAIQLSSPPLYESLRRLDSARGLTRGKSERSYRSLLRYFVRSSAKATPFARFCTIALGGFESAQTADAHESLYVSGVATQGFSQVAPNKALLSLCWSSLRSDPESQHDLVVSPNTTATCGESEIAFLSSVGGEESLRRMRARPRLLELWQAICAVTPARTKEIWERVASINSSFRDRAEVEQAVQRFVSCGMLEVEPLVCEMSHEWIEKLDDALKGISSNLASHMQGCIEVVRAALSNFAAESSDMRAHSLQRVQAAVEELETLCGRRLNVRDSPVVFEDAATRARVHLARTPSIQALLDELSEYLDVTQHLSWPMGSANRLMSLFASTFDKDIESVTLARFYEVWALSPLNWQLKKASRTDSDSSTRDKRAEQPEKSTAHTVDARWHAIQRLSELIRQRWKRTPLAEEISIPLADLAATIGSRDNIQSSRSTSAAMFLSFAATSRDDGGHDAILPSGMYFGGHGKYWSRFVSLLPELASTTNTRTSFDGPILCEIVGDESFNANVHPPLLPAYLSYPGKRSPDDGTVVRWQDLDVVCAHARGRLELVHRPDGREVIPIDLGFLNINMRPPLYRLLTEFSSAISFGLRLPDFASDGKRVLQSGEVEVRPRIRVGTGIVVSRRRWSVLGSDIPKLELDGDEADFCERLVRWQRSSHIPTEAYFSLRAHDEAVTMASDEIRASNEPESSGRAASTVSDWRKPHFVCFTSPLLMLALGRLLTVVSNVVVHFEECLPPRTKWIRDEAGERFASECVLQWDSL